MKPYLHSIVLKVAEKNRGCKLDSECVYEEKAGGFIIAKDKLSVVKDCFKLVSQSLCRSSVNPKTGFASYNMENPFKELEMPIYLSAPEKVSCINNECVPSGIGKPSLWKSAWASLDPSYKAPNSFCSEYVKNPLKNYKKSR
ncbi:MAG: hypothetical protein EOP04_04590 [Proteobacteria bacterium]|nr:MAG: hypothetical protein EOP04_04590 [Pseudomonadota bacterium]